MYGTNDEKSDEDFKGIFLPTKDEVLLGKVPKSYNFTTKPKGSGNKNTSEDIDTEIYSLHYFLKLALEGQTVAIDMLHAPIGMIVEKDGRGIWEYLVDRRNLFYTKNQKAFVGYARKQAAKYGIKGSRLNDAKRVLDFLQEEWDKSHKCPTCQFLKLNDLWHRLPKGEHIHFTDPDKHGTIFYQVCGKKMQKTLRVDYALDIIKKFYDEYGKRAKQAANNENIDWKAVSHAIRAAMQIKEIFLYNDITFPLKEAEFLKKVKSGKLDYNTVVVPRLEDLMDEIEELSNNSTLPQKPDYKFWEKRLCRILEDNLFYRD